MNLIKVFKNQWVITIVGGTIAFLLIGSFIRIKTSLSLGTIKTIDNEYHHLGNVSWDIFEPSEPEGYLYEKNFNLDQIGKKMFLILTAKDIEPVLELGPVIITINEGFVCFLNKHPRIERILHSNEHTAPWQKDLKISVPTGYFKIGQNKIRIEVLESPYTKDIDDINFCNLRVQIK